MTAFLGFSQLFSLVPQSNIEQFELGLDAMFSTNLSVGVEFIRKDLDLAKYWVYPSDCCAFHEGIDQKLSRAYFHWSATDRLSLSLAHEKEAYTGTLYNPPESVSTQLSPFTISYHCLTGIYLKANGTYVDQKITLCCQEDRTNFWNIDAIIGYRFPNRYSKAELVIKNILDERFNYYDRDFYTEMFLEPRFQPKRQLFARVVLNFQGPS